MPCSEQLVEAVLFWLLALVVFLANIDIAFAADQDLPKTQIRLLKAGENTGDRCRTVACPGLHGLQCEPAQQVAARAAGQPECCSA